jgi:hypothetical protein
VGAVRRILPALVAILAVAGCGHRQRSPALAKVRVSLSTPADLSQVEHKTVTVQGRVVPPTARVLVDGVQADVRRGAFTASVTLAGGANLIDVQAAAPRHPAAMTVLRVTRVVPVAIPHLEGSDPDDAVKDLQGLGLHTRVHRNGGLLDELLPGDPTVCFTDPAAGTKVRVGTTVDIATARSC